MAGAAALLALVAVVVATLRTGARPEEAVAAGFVTAMLAGDAEAAYALTAPDYRLLVRESDLAALATALAVVAGEEPRVDVVGSERSAVEAPVESLVGYTGRTAAGPVEGVVSLVQLSEDGEWLVHDLSYRFPETAPDELAELHAVTRALNEALGERAGAVTVPSGED